MTVALSSPAAQATTSAPISSQGEDFEDDEYTLFAPGGFVYVDIAIPRKEVGPAPGMHVETHRAAYTMYVDKVRRVSRLYVGEGMARR